MNILVSFEIRDESMEGKKLLGYLFYFEKSKRFFSEILSGIDEWEAPFMFAARIRKGQFSLSSDISMNFVRQRIIPAERQNIGNILKENGLTTYDEYKLLLLSEGRCAQDELFLKRIKPENIAEEIKDRLRRKVKDVLCLSGKRAVVFFKDDTVRLIDLCDYLKERRFLNISGSEELFRKIRVAPGGNGIEWGEERNIPAEMLYKAGKHFDLSLDELLFFVKSRLVNTAEAAEFLGCKRQYINQLEKVGSMEAVRFESNNRIFLRSDIECL